MREYDMKKRILFLIPNLKHGGAEKVLVNLVNNLNPDKYDITVQTLFDVGICKEQIKPHVTYIPGLKFQFRGNSHFFKLFSPELLYRFFVRRKYDVVISYLEGPTARIAAGCCCPETKTACWIHTEIMSEQSLTKGFRSAAEAERLYQRFDKIVGVSHQVSQAINNYARLETEPLVLYNTNETEAIQQAADIEPENSVFSQNHISVCTVGRLIPVKGFDRLLNVHKRLLDEGLKHHIYILGIGEEQSALEQQMKSLGIEDSVTLLGFQKNPYQYVSRCDLYVCSSHREGFSTAVTESLIVGTPVVSTNCSGAKELLGEQDEYGLVVDNSEEGIYQGMKKMLSNPELLSHYKEQAKLRGSFFSRTETVRAVEEMLDSL